MNVEVENVVENISELDVDVDADVVPENEVDSAAIVDAALGADVEVYSVHSAPGAAASAPAVQTLSAAFASVIVSAVSVLDQDVVVFSAVHLAVVVV